MAEPRISVLVVARDEAHNLAECLAAARWADERVVVVDAASRDATLAIARRDADVVAVRTFDDFASQRNAGLAMAGGDWVLSVDADERITPELAVEIRRVIADPDAPYRGYRVPIRSEILGRPFAFSGTQHDLPLRLFRRDSGRWVGLVHENVDLRGPAGTVQGELRHRTIPTMSAFLEKIDRYTTLEAEDLAGARRPVRPGDLTLRPAWTFFKLYVLKQGFRDGVEGFMFCLFSGVSAAVRAWKHRELTRLLTQSHDPDPLTPALSPVGRGRPLGPAATVFPLGQGERRPLLPSGEKVPEGRMRGVLAPRSAGRPPLTAVGLKEQSTRESIVAARFDAIHARFKPEVADDDPRVQGIVASLGPLPGRRVLDLGCGKGRFARVLAERGARVVGLDVSSAMLAASGRAGLDRVLGSARRLPFGGSSFDAAIAVEVFEHLDPHAIDDACREVIRVLRPGGLFVLVDKSVLAMNARRPWIPAVMVKWLDQRRGLWMYPAGGPVRERWFRPLGMRRRLLRWFREVRVTHLLSRDEAGRFPFRAFPSTRLFVLWAARAPGGAA